jgi:L-ascorbate metabolism protein UlaG (beta-lactamase superfamily)
LASFGGGVVLLDAWVAEGTMSGYVPVSVSDLIAARPQYIYVGHGHFDHMGHVSRIAQATGAKVVGTAEHCRVARAGASRPELVSCVPVLDAAGRPFSAGELVGTGPLPSVGSLLGPNLRRGTAWGTIGTPAEGPAGLGVRVIMSKHSGTRPPDPADPRPPASQVPNPSPVIGHLPGPMDAVEFAIQAADSEAGTLAYLFTIGDLSLLWHDSSGPLAYPGEDGAAEIRAALRSLGKVDVEVGAILEYHQVTNGLKDVRAYVEAARPKVFVPTHHDNFLPPVTAEGRAYYRALVAELGRIPSRRRPYLCFITDPESYRAPLSLTASQRAGAAVGVISGCLTPG